MSGCKSFGRRPRTTGGVGDRARDAAAGGVALSDRSRPRRPANPIRRSARSLGSTPRRSPCGVIGLLRPARRILSEIDSSLVALHERPRDLRRNQLHLVTQCRKLALPVVRAATRLHSKQRRRAIGEVLHHFPPLLQSSRLCGKHRGATVLHRRGQNIQPLQR